MGLTREEFFANHNISKTAKVLRLLKEKRVVTNKELNTIAFRYGARIHELRREGHIIVSNNLGDGLWSYHYLGVRQDKEYGC